MYSKSYAFFLLALAMRRHQQQVSTADVATSFNDSQQQQNPLLAALLLNYSLGFSPKSQGFNHPLHLPTNPYVALLLSHYGKYISAGGHPPGIYGYAAANNYHNNLPFGAYKIYEDEDS